MNKLKLIHYSLYIAMAVAVAFTVHPWWACILIFVILGAVDLSSFESGRRVSAERFIGAVDSMVMNAMHQENFDIEPADLEAAPEESE
jgi:hypothetical protein